MDKYERLYYAAVCFTNDMKHVHLHAVGNKFDRIHALAGEYYDKANDEADTFAELALEYGKNVSNASYAASLIGYKPCAYSHVNWEIALKEFDIRIRQYLTAMEQVRYSGDISTDVESLLDDIMRDWKKEVNYKNKKRMED